MTRSGARGESGQVRRIQESRSRRSSGNPYQICNAHIRGQRIPSWFRDFTLDVDGRSLPSIRVSMYQHPVAGLQQKIVDRIPLKGLAQIDAENPQAPVALS